jgi:hypothetical protein
LDKDDLVVSHRPSRSKFLIKELTYLLMGISAIAISFRLFEPKSAHLDYLLRQQAAATATTDSVEDLVAQGELSAKADEDFIARMIPNRSRSEQEELTMLYQAVYEGKQNFLEGNITALPLMEDEEDELLSQNSTTANATRRTDWGPPVKTPKGRTNRTVVGYILPVFTCYQLSGQGLNQHGLNEPSNDREFLDAALMLQASVHKNSARNPSSGSAYDYEMIALIHRGIESCAGGINRTALLERLGYRVEVVREPIHINNVKNQYLQRHAPRSNGGRAGMREMIRLYAFRMIEYRIVVLLEPSTWLLHPADAIFDVLMHGASGHPWAEKHQNHFVKETFYPNGTITKASSFPKELDIVFTRDYSSMIQNSWTTGISLAFVPLRPSMLTYRRLINTYQSVPYGVKHGWDNKGYAHYAGSMQTKGLLTYYFSEKQPHRKLELYRCIYNNLADVPYIAGVKGKRDNCRDVKEHKLLPDGTVMPCTDCRIQPFHEIVVANFAICQVPWVCPYIDSPTRIPLLVPTVKMCRRFHESWFNMRKMVEENFVDPKYRVKSTGTFHPEVFHGYCQPGGSRGGAYVTMDKDLRLPHGFEALPFPVQPKSKVQD